MMIQGTIHSPEQRTIFRKQALRVLLLLNETTTRKKNVFRDMCAIRIQQP